MLSHTSMVHAAIMTHSYHDGYHALTHSYHDGARLDVPQPAFVAIALVVLVPSASAVEVIGSALHTANQLSIYVVGDTALATQLRVRVCMHARVRTVHAHALMHVHDMSFWQRRVVGPHVWFEYGASDWAPHLAAALSSSHAEVIHAHTHRAYVHKRGECPNSG